MIEHIMGSKAKIKVLREMRKNPKREYTVEDISRIAGIPYGTAYPAVHELIRSRILLSKRLGRSTVVNYNDSHILAGKVSELLKWEQDAYLTIAKDLAKKVSKQHIKSIILFGSVAREDVLDPGDIDILFIHGPGFERKDVDCVVESLMDRYDVLISPLFVSVQDMREKIKRSDIFIGNVKKEGIVLYGDEEWSKK